MSANVKDTNEEHTRSLNIKDASLSKPAISPMMKEHRCCDGVTRGFMWQRENRQ